MLFQVRPLAGACRTQAAWRACVVAGRLIPAAPAGLTPPGLLSSRRRRGGRVRFGKNERKKGKYPSHAATSTTTTKANAMVRKRGALLLAPSVALIDAFP